MGDPNHLEKFGRELKCPVCLSLFNSSVSLTCNHVFCNACIVKSMKSGSNCPVCKVPYRRREIRPAPHMDNLVNIYKSMEVASGINIFVTQNEPSTKSAAAAESREEDDECGEQDIPENCQDKAENPGTSKRKRFRRNTKSNLEHSGTNAIKPSCPTKKRVQVAKYPLPETPIQAAKFDGKSMENICQDLKDNSVVWKENHVSNEKAVFSPFFWLREEEDKEKSSQHTDLDTYITPPDVPSFSDLKDSDDESSSLASPRAGDHVMHGGADFLDSEMFEWTQRASSPELLPSPVKTQVADTYEDDESREKRVQSGLEVANSNGNPSTENCEHMDLEQGNGNLDEVCPLVSPPSNTNTNCQIADYKMTKRCKRGRNITTNKRAIRNKDHVSEHVDSEEVPVNVAEKQAYNSNCSSSISKRTRRKSKVGLGTHTTESRPGNHVALSGTDKTPDEDGRNKALKLSTTSGKKQSADENLCLKTGESGQNLRSHPEDQCLRSKRRRTYFLEVNMAENITTLNQTDTMPEPSLLSAGMTKNKKNYDLEEPPSKTFKEVKFASNLEYKRKSRCEKKMKVSSSGISENGLGNQNQQVQNNVSAMENQSTEKVPGHTDVRVQDSLRVKKLLKADDVALCKCETPPGKVQCSFCHASEDSEASGELVHYYNGRPVAADYNGGSKVIHSHRNCTEWAPNVYFEDDTAINLEAELSRSRRIKCSCCGLKGAALGCYEKSCRKSFHVPCAKSMSECRWDTVNFVMLCPLHASSKLPNENSTPPASRKKCISKGQSDAQLNQVSIKNGVDTSNCWNSSRDKFILCCSALTVEQREIVSKFERLSKVTVLKKWDSSVTHVIASTDENGRCKRTLKFMMGILEGKWILNIEWVKACMTAMKPVNEEPYEITSDTHGIKNGPRFGRMRCLNKQPKLFDGSKFYLMAGFESSYKGYLQDLVIAAGGTILHRKPISGDQGAQLPDSSSTFVVYSVELPDKCDRTNNILTLDQRRSDAEVLASSTGAVAVSNTWVLNSIAACRLQSYAE